MLKSGVRRLAGMVGFEIKRKPDDERLDIYRAIYPDAELSKKPFINVGAGSFQHPYWTNVDYATDWYSGVQNNIVHYDIMTKEPMPFENAFAYIVYTSHTIEHVKSDAVQSLFKDVYRILKPGGIVRITTGPDAETDYRALLANDADWFYWDEAYATVGSYEKHFRAPATSVPLAERWLHHVASQLAMNSLSPSPRKYDAEKIMAVISSKTMTEALDYFTEQCTFQPDWPGNHVSWWTHEKVMQYLRNAGFGNVYRSGHAQSASPLMRRSGLFDTTHPQMSLYVEAVK